MPRTVEIRAFFSWNKVSLEKAYEFCNSFMKSIQTTHIREEKIEIINKDHLRGITYEELEKEVNQYA